MKTCGRVCKIWKEWKEWKECKIWRIWKICMTDVDYLRLRLYF